MGTLNDLISRHKSELKRKALRARYALVFSGFTSLSCFFTFLVAQPAGNILDFDEPLFSPSLPHVMIMASNFFIGFAIKRAIDMWRYRQMRIKLMIAEAFMREEDSDTALRMVLEPVFGERVWDSELERGRLAYQPGGG